MKLINDKEGTTLPYKKIPINKGLKNEREHRSSLELK